MRMYVSVQYKLGSSQSYIIQSLIAWLLVKMHSYKKGLSYPFVGTYHDNMQHDIFDCNS